jgi:hypothetical protein
MHKRFVLGLVLVVMACKTNSMLGVEAHAQSYLLDNIGGRLTADDGQFLLVQDLPPGDTVLVLATTAQRTRTLSLNTSADSTGVMIRAMAQDSVDAISRVIIQGNATILASCAGASGICNVLWPRAKMTAGDNNVYFTAYNVKGVRTQTRATLQRP